MTFSLFSIAILLIFFSVTATEVYRSIKKGFRMTLISLAIVVFSAIFSALVTYLISEIVCALAFNLIINNFAVYSELVQSYSWAGSFIEAIAGMILGSLLFVTVFFTVRAVTRFIVDMVCKSKISHFANTPAYCKEENSYFDQHDKALSVITGVIISVIVTMVITSPIMGTLDVANKALGMVDKLNMSNTESSAEDVAESVTGIDVSLYANDFCGNVFYQLGGKLMYYSAASAEVYGERVHLVSEVDALADVFDDLEYVYSALVDPKSATEEQVSRIYSLCDNIDRLKLCSGPLGEFVSTFAGAWQEGDRFLGISKPVVNELLEPAFDEILSVCRYTDYHSANANMITLLRLYATAMDSDIFNVDVSDFDSLVSYVNESDIIKRLDAILAENPNMSGISVSSIALAAVSKYIREFDYDISKYDVLMEDIADAINKVNNKGYATEEEKARVLASYAQEYIKEYGVNVPDDMATSVAEEILKNLGGLTVTEEDVRRVFSKYSK